jgi:hypothetical protein
MQWNMLKSIAVAQELIEVTYDEAALSFPLKSKARCWYSRGENNNIFLLPSNFSVMIRAIVDGKTVVRAETGSFESLDPQTVPKAHLGSTAWDWKQKTIWGPRDNTFPAEGGLRPPPNVIEDMLAYNGITIPDNINVDWENIYNSIRDPYYKEEM